VADCLKCGGSGKIREIDIANATYRMVPCQECGGQGVKPDNPIAESGDGVVFKQPKGKFGWFVKLLDHTEVAWIECIMYPLLDMDRKPQTVGEVTLKWLQILRMRTVGKHRRKGYMREVLDTVRIHTDIQRIETSWHDSTSDGRNFLLSQGFKQDGEMLIWRQGMPKEA
jgi:hypothetical protein